MRFIQDQVDIATSAIRLEKPVIKLVRSYGTDIGIKVNNTISFDPEFTQQIDKVVLEAVRGRVSVKLNLDKKAFTYKVDDSSITESVLYHVETEILGFLQNHGGHANNRLSKMYKWYKEKIDGRSLKSNEKLAQDLYNIVKFIKAKSVLSDETITATRTLLTLIKDRYEPILGKIDPHAPKKGRRRW